MIAGINSYDDNENIARTKYSMPASPNEISGAVGEIWLMQNMITAFIIANDDAKALTRTLNALIGATVEGLVREVVLLAESNNATAEKLADEAGCLFGLPADFAKIVPAAKGDWLLVLEAGALPEHGWIETLENHVQANGTAARFTRSPLAKKSLRQKLFGQNTPLSLGLLVQKGAVLALGKSAYSTPQSLVKAAKPKPLPAHLRPASNVHPSAA